MKGIDLFCASQASTAICVSTMDQHPMLRHGGRAIDRHNPHLRDGRRSNTTTTTTAPTNNLITPSSSSSSQSQKAKKPAKRRSHSKSKSRTHSARQHDLTISPAGSSRYLLSDNAFMDVVTEFEPVLANSLVPDPIQLTRYWSIKQPEEYPTIQPAGSSSSTDITTTTNDPQVVVLRVSLHCRGCEGKVRKHISKMKGVTSFNIDFAMKKVTVIGDVTPLGVLASISRVKNAQFWPFLASSSLVKSTH